MNKYSTNRVVHLDAKGFNMPTEFLMQALQVKQQKFDENYKLANAITSVDVPVLEKDRPLLQYHQDMYRQKVADLVKKSNGDFSQIKYGLDGLAQQIKKDLSHTGMLGLAGRNYTHAQEWVVNTRKRGNKLNDNLSNAYYTRNLANYKGAHTNQVLNLQDLPDYVPIASELGKVAKDMHVNENGDTFFNSTKDGQIITTKVKSKHRDYSAIHDVVDTELMSNPLYRKQLLLEQEYLGTSAEDARRAITDAVSKQYQVKSNENTIIDRDRKYDEKYLQDRKRYMDKKDKYEEEQRNLNLYPLYENIDTQKDFEASTGLSKLGAGIAAYGGGFLDAVSSEVRGVWNYVTGDTTESNEIYGGDKAIAKIKDENGNYKYSYDGTPYAQGSLSNKTRYYTDKRYNDNSTIMANTSSNQAAQKSIQDYFLYVTKNPSVAKQKYNDFVSNIETHRRKENPNYNIGMEDAVSLAAYASDVFKSEKAQRENYLVRAIPMRSDQSKYLQEFLKNTPTVNYRNTKTGVVTSGKDMLAIDKSFDFNTNAFSAASMSPAVNFQGELYEAILPSNDYSVINAKNANQSAMYGGEFVAPIDDNGQVSFENGKKAGVINVTRNGDSSHTFYMTENGNVKVIDPQLGYKALNEVSNRGVNTLLTNGVVKTPKVSTF